MRRCAQSRARTTHRKVEIESRIWLYPATDMAVEDDFGQDGPTLRVRQFDPQKIYAPDAGRLRVDDTAKELGRALSRCT